MKHFVIATLVLTLCVGSLALADGEAAGEQPEQPKQPKQVTPIQKIVKELKGLVARERARPEFDEKLVQDLERLVKTFEAEANKPIKLEDLPEKDRERLKEEVREEIVAEREAGGEGGDPGEEWREREKNRRAEQAVEGVELTDKQRETVDALLKDYADDTAAAYRSGEVAKINDLKKDLEKNLKKAVGNKKAREIINNVNKQLGGRGRWGR